MKKRIILLLLTFSVSLSCVVTAFASGVGTFDYSGYIVPHAEFTLVQDPENDGYYGGELVAVNIADSSFVSAWDAYTPTYTDAYYDGMFPTDCLSAFAVVDGITYPVILNLWDGSFFFAPIDQPFLDPPGFVFSEVPFILGFSRSVAFPLDEQNLFCYFPASYFADPSAETQTISVSLYIGSLPEDSEDVTVDTATLVRYSTHFLTSCIGLLNTPYGIIVVGMIITLIILAIWKELRP